MMMNAMCFKGYLSYYINIGIEITAELIRNREKLESTREKVMMMMMMMIEC